MRWGRIYIIPTESTLAVPPTCLQGAWHARSLQSKYAAAASSASRAQALHRPSHTRHSHHAGSGVWCVMYTLEPSSVLQAVRALRNALAASAVFLAGVAPVVTRTSVAPGAHVGGTAVEVPAGIKFAFAGRPNRTDNARRRCTAMRCTHVFATFPQETQRTQQFSYCILFNNRCVLSARSCVSQNTHRRRASAVRFSAFRLPNPPQTRRREVRARRVVTEALVKGPPGLKP